MNPFRESLYLLGKLFRRFSRLEKILTVALFMLMMGILVKLLIPLALEVSFGEGGIYGEGLIGKPRHLNPVFVDFNDVDRDIGSLIFSGLVKYDPVTQNFVHDVAQAIERSQNNLTYFVHIKKDVLWHDKKPFTIDDVYFTYKEVIQDLGFKNPLLREAFADVKIEKVDEDTIAFTLPEVNSFFISFLTVGILPAHILRGTPIAELEKHPLNRNPIGTGPFEFSKTQESINENTSSVTLVRFDSFYGEKPKLKSIRFSFFKNWGEIIHEKKALSGIPKIIGNDTKEKISDARFVVQSYQLPQYVAAFFNLEQELLKSKRFRQVLMKSIPKEKLRELLQSEVTIIDTPYLNRLEKEWIHQYDTKATSSILKELGFRKGEDGFLKNSKDQVPTLTLLARSIPNTPHDKEIELVSSFLRDQWQAMGIRVIVRREEGENFSILLRKREYDLLLVGQNLGYNNDAFSFWHSSKRGEKGLNLSELRSFRVDSVLEDLRQIFDSKKKAKRLKDLELFLSDEMPALFLYTPTYRFALDKAVRDFTVAPQYAFPGDRFAHIAKVSIAK